MSECDWHRLWPPEGERKCDNPPAVVRDGYGGSRNVRFCVGHDPLGGSMRYRSKPQEVEAVQWTGDNEGKVMRFAPPNVVRREYTGDGVWHLELRAGKDGAQDWVPLPVGHWIVRQPGDPSDVWPNDPDYFAKKYEPVEPS